MNSICIHFVQLSRWERNLHFNLNGRIYWSSSSRKTSFVSKENTNITWSTILNAYWDIYNNTRLQKEKSSWYLTNLYFTNKFGFVDTCHLIGDSFQIMYVPFFIWHMQIDFDLWLPHSANSQIITRNINHRKWIMESDNHYETHRSFEVSEMVVSYGSCAVAKSHLRRTTG